MNNKKSENTINMPVLNNFYRDRYRILTLITLIVFGLNIVCGFMAFYLFVHKPDDIYVPAIYNSKEGKLPPAVSHYSITPRIPVDQSNMGLPELNEWLLNVLRNSFSYDSQAFDVQLARNKSSYTDQGWKELNNILGAMVNFRNYTNRQAIVSVMQPVGAPALTNSGVKNNTYEWDIEIPIAIQFFGSVSIFPRSMTLSIHLVRTSMDNDVYGIKVASIKPKDGITVSRTYTPPGSSSGSGSIFG